MPKGVYKRPPVEERFWRRVDKATGPVHPTLGRCWIWTGGRTYRGYGKFGRRSCDAYGAHRFSLELARGPLAPGLLACHHCDNPPCVNPAHLFAGTASDNTRDMFAKGREHKQDGSLNHRAMFDENAVSDIRRRLAAGETGKLLASEYGVSRPTISDIKNRKSWTHVL